MYNIDTEIEEVYNPSIEIYKEVDVMNTQIIVAPDGTHYMRLFTVINKKDNLAKKICYLWNVTILNQRQ